VLGEHDFSPFVIQEIINHVSLTCVTLMLTTEGIFILVTVCRSLRDCNDNNDRVV
jgi:hypothetical protein